MVDLRPVRAWYPPGDPIPVSQLVCPVYDTLGEDDFRRFGGLDFNAATFVARPNSMSSEQFLDSAPGRLRAAIDARAFVQDSEPALYVYGIRYVPPLDVLEALPPGDRRKEYLLLGLVGQLRIDGDATGDIALHERTFADRVRERTRLMDSTGMQFAPILAGYTRRDHGLNNLLESILGLDRRKLDFAGAVPPLVEAELDGTSHRIWRLSDPDVRSRILQMTAEFRLLILDGHHRFTAARQRGEAGRATAPLTMLVESHDRALQLLPWHRVLGPRRIDPPELIRRAVERFPKSRRWIQPLSTATSLEELLTMSNNGERGFLVVGNEVSAKVVGPPSEDGGYDFDLLHGFLEGSFGVGPGAFQFARSPRHALSTVLDPGSRSYGGLAFLLPRLRTDAVARRAFGAGHVMAEKSTMFLPKVAEGLLLAPAG